ncbi:LamG domain-containing protein, partial [Neptuniibacter sp.]|uniref:LamG domain-containing protein n=1 Tax=Neptuniibacter sp. TaxID=1962643 RepID=UPI00263091A6
ARNDAAVITSSDSDTPFVTYLRRLPTTYQYTWTETGSVTQNGAPAGGSGSGASWSNAYSTLFDGDNEYADLGTIGAGHSLMLNGSDATISAWIKQQPGGDQWQRIVDKSNNSSAANGYGLYAHAPNRQIWVQVDGNGWRTSNNAYEFDTWTHVVGVITASSFTIYLDGAEVSGSWGSGSATQPPNVSTNMRIGTWNHSTAREFDGNIDEISIWNEALSSSEVTELYNSGSPDNLADHSTYSNLVSWWRMGDDDTYPTLKDNKGSNDGTMTNMEFGDIEADIP